MDKFDKFVEEKLGGVLCKGKGDGKTTACVLMAHNIVFHGKATDDPVIAGTWNYAGLNDAFRDDKKRTLWMRKIRKAYDGARDWPEDKQKFVSGAIVLCTIREIIAELPGLPDKIRAKCRSVKTLGEGRKSGNAADAALSAALADAAYAAIAAADAAYSDDAADAVEYAADAACAAARAAADAYSDANAAFAADAVAIKACRIWLRAVDKYESAAKKDGE